MHSLNVLSLVGFEDLGNRDDFETSTLEAKLFETGMTQSFSPGYLADTVLGVLKHEQDNTAQHTYTTSSTTVRSNIRGGSSTNNDFEFDL
jgi:hypothetical protein